MDHIEYSFKSADGINLFGQAWLPDTERKGLVLLIHGLGEHSGRYAHVGKMLADEGYILSGFDLRGHGKSDGKRGHSPSFNAFMGDISKFISENESRFPGLPLFLYGHSLGGLLVLNFVPRKKPKVNGLIVTGPGLRNELENQKVKVAFVNLMSNIVPTLTLSTGLVADQLSQDKTVVEAYISDPLVHDRASLSMAKYTLQSIDWAFDHAQEIHDPILVMQGSMDKLCFPSGTTEYVSKLSGDVTLKFWEGCYHEIHNEPCWGEVVVTMIDWLNEHLN